MMDFTLAIYKRGQVAVPRLLFDYLEAFDFNYNVLGRYLVLLSVLSGDSFPDGEYRIPESHPAFAEIRKHLAILEEHDMVKHEEADGEIRFSFAPLFSRLRAHWVTDMENRRRGKAVVGEAWQGHVPLVRYAEQRLGRALSVREVGYLRDWADTYGFEHEVIKRVIDEGIDRGKRRFDYMNAVARSWRDAGVRNVDDLERAQSDYRQLMGRHAAVIRALRIDRPLTVPEQKLLARWTEEWGFDEALILKACEATVNIRNPSLGYVNKVLEAWHQKGISSVAEAEAEMRQKPAAAAGDARGKRMGANFQLPVKPKDKGYYEQLIEKPRP